MKTIVHVGAHKTGSSLIQKFLRDNRAALADKGVHYITRRDMNTLAGWGRHLRQRPDLLRGRLRAVAAERYRAAIASHENIVGQPLIAGRPGLYPNAHRNLTDLAAVLDGFDYRVVLYIRPAADFVESYYLQTVHEGSTATFAQWSRELVDIQSLSWRPVVDAMAAVFGPERVVVRDFTEIRLGQEEFLRRFFAAVDLDPGIDLSYSPVRNASVSDKGMRMALAANAHVRSGRERKAVRVFLQKHFSNRQFPRPVLFTEEQRQTIADLYDEEYRSCLSV